LFFVSSFFVSSRATYFYCFCFCFCRLGQFKRSSAGNTEGNAAGGISMAAGSSSSGKHMSAKVSGGRGAIGMMASVDSAGTAGSGSRNGAGSPSPMGGGRYAPTFNSSSPTNSTAAPAVSATPDRINLNLETKRVVTHPSLNTESPDRCSLCWFSFTLFRRPHHCRLCDALCCDECSKKRCLVAYSQVRYNEVYFRQC
jgi:hypothetical protein